MKLKHTESREANRTFLKGAFSMSKWWKLRNGLSQRSPRVVSTKSNITLCKPRRRKRENKMLTHK